MADTLTIALRKALQTKLLGKCNTVFYRTARGGNTGNFVVYDLTNVLDDENLWQTTLEVNVLGPGQNTEPVETLADEIWQDLDHWYYLNGDLGYTCYQQSRAPVSEETDTLNHQRLVFLIRLYK